MIGELLGGLGCFLLGMGLMTEGVRSVGGASLRRAIRRFTGTLPSAIVTGFVATACLQSSSATTLTAIGFVRAGVLPLAAAVGVVYGANVGTTATSWIVAGLGLQVDIGAIAMPLVGIGALTKILGRGRLSVAGSTAAGFGLLFVGIELMKNSMTDTGGLFDLSMITGTAIWVRAGLVVLGAVMTVVMQSSSAAVATTLAAVHGGAIGLVDAAAVVIGQNVGTTVTAVMGAAGGSVPAKRTALAHVIFNIGTAGVAFVLLPFFVAIADRSVGSDNPALALAAFHTVFNVVGVLIFVPLTGRFVRLLHRAIPDRALVLTRRLHGRGVRVPSVDVVAARRTVTEIAAEVVGLAERALLGREPEPPCRFSAETIRDAIADTYRSLAELKTGPNSPEDYARHVSTLHAIDHVNRLLDALDETENGRRARGMRGLSDANERLARVLADTRVWASADLESPPPPLHEASTATADRRREARVARLETAAAGSDPVEAKRDIEAYRWVDRLGYHAWRAFHHLALAREGQVGAAEGQAGDGERSGP